VLIELADGDDPRCAAAVDTLRAADPESLAKPFAALAKSRNPIAQKLAMERLPAAAAHRVKPLIDALSGDDPTRARSRRRLAKAPRPWSRRPARCSPPPTSRSPALPASCSHRHVAPQAIDELVDAAEGHGAHTKARPRDQIVLERVIGD